jgi:hypothetical protein
MSEANEFRLYAEEAMRESANAETEDERLAKKCSSQAPVMSGGKVLYCIRCLLCPLKRILLRFRVFMS